MVQPSQQHVSPCVKGVKWGLGTRDLRMVAAFWAGYWVTYRGSTKGPRSPAL